MRDLAYILIAWIAIAVIGAVLWTAVVRGHKRGPRPVVVWDERTYGVVAVEDPTPDDLMSLANALAECPSTALAEHGGGYCCELDGGHPLPHRNGVWVWDIGDDVVIDLGAVGDLAAAVNRETLGIWPSPVEPRLTLREESIRCRSRYHYGLDGHYLCDLDLGHALPHADSRGQARVRWYGTDEWVTA